ncbi:MAG: prolyl aminopeptidase [Chlamydiae bacterium CG10_big_fil_rev_8_21_14_0_10_42_34]|nr:MAG: prolyl aminopeptidase [Chlamydiae bacterium CG10_big_fil_rev_8_21_14_0_10_42_34]
MRTKYPPIEPNQTGFLKVDSHELYWEESGNPKGLPVIFLHGGPGSGTDAGHRCYFDPKIYRIVLMDQRGCGKSKPHASLTDNTTWHLVEDIERLRKLLEIEKWVVFGGSWGSTLSLAYAETHPSKVLAIVLRGIFLGRPKELRWFYQFGAHHIFPDEWEKYIDPIPPEERGELIQAYYRRLTSPDVAVRKRAASVWSAWEGAALKLIFDPTIFMQFTDDTHADAIARIECHYFVNNCFFKTDNWLIEQVSSVRKIPAFIIQGRYDIICPMESAWELHKAWPEAELTIVKDAGHAASEPGIIDALISATDYLGQSLRPSSK